MSNPKATVTPIRPQLVSMFGRAPSYDQVALTVAPLRAREVGAAPVGPVADLTRLARTWLLIGRGGSGKSLVARWLAGKMQDAGLLDQTLLAALDPTNRTLAAFFDGVHQPATRDPGEAVTFLRSLLSYLQAGNRMHGIWDFGGGDLALARMVETDPAFDWTMREHDAAMVACYLLTPSIDDLSVLRSFEDAGFRPEATVLVLNMGRAESLTDFGALRAQAGYKAVLARGGVEIVMPRLEPTEVALEIERKRLTFGMARDGTVPAGSQVDPIIGLNGMMVRAWLRDLDAAFAPIAGWLPWTN